MNFFRKHKTKLIAALFIVAALASAWFFGGNYGVTPVDPGLLYAGPQESTGSPAQPAPATQPSMPDTAPATQPLPPEPAPAAPDSVPASKLPVEETSVNETSGAETATQAPPPSAPVAETTPQSTPPTAPDSTPAQTTQPEDVSSQGIEKGDTSYSQMQGMVLDPETGKDRYSTDPVPTGKPLPVEPQNAVISDRAYSCTLSVRCDTILNNMKLLDQEKHELIPEDGIIFPEAVVTFYEGESVFNVLLREMRRAKIHMEFVNTPIYNSAYIEGIHNLYEFDVGELSGWMYKVNGWFPNYGASRYQLQDGDVIEWVYTCDLGRDVNGYYATGGSD